MSGAIGWRHRLSRSAAGIRADVSFAIIDLVLVAFAYSTASALRMLDPSVGRADEYWISLFRLLPLIAAVHILANFIVGAYGHVWEFASIGEARLVILANSIASFSIWGLAGAWDVMNPDRLNPIPLSVLVMGSTFTILGMGAVRFRSRLFSFNRQQSNSPIPKVLVVGTGPSAARFAHDAITSNAAEVVGFVGDSGSDASRRIAGRPVLGELSDIREIVERRTVTQIVMVGPSDSLVRKVVDLSLDNRVRLSVLPSFEGMLNEHHAITDPRDLEVADMLPRATVDTHLASVRDSIRGKTVLITGAGGSIGSEILRQVLDFEPERVIALDHDETHLHDAMLDLQTDRTELILCDIRDRTRVFATFDRWKPTVVFHAAAHKHVPILEANPDEAVKTNVIGTANVVEACQRFGSLQFVLISTDKAVAPANVMGATKRMAEIITQAAMYRDSGCVFTAVRFGNVLGSRGSVVPTFVKQIQRGGPVTITDPAMTRFFMTISEAVQLVLQAGSLANGGEVHVLDMGQPVRIVDLAHRMIRMAGLVPGRDIPIEIVGTRPGEKITEELAMAPLQPSDHPRIAIASPELPGGPAAVQMAVEEMRQAAESYDVVTMMEILHKTLASELSIDSLDIRDDVRLPEWS